MIRLPLASAQAVSKCVEKWIEVVVTDDERSIIGILAVPGANRIEQLNSQGGLAGAFFPKDDRGAWIAAIPEDFIPCRVIDRLRTMLLENVVGLSVFLTERIDPDAVVFEELTGFHGKMIRRRRSLNRWAPVARRTCSNIPYALSGKFCEFA